MAEFRSTRAPGVPDEPPAGTGAATVPGCPGAGTRTCSPSWRTRARFSAFRSAPSAGPPAAVRASATRLPADRVTTPGRRTRPATWTTTEAELSRRRGRRRAQGRPAATGAVLAGSTSPCCATGSGQDRHAANPRPAATRTPTRTAPATARGPTRTRTARNPGGVRSAIAATTPPRHPRRSAAGPAVRRTRPRTRPPLSSANASSRSSWSSGSSPRIPELPHAPVRGRGAPHRDGGGVGTR